MKRQLCFCEVRRRCKDVCLGKTFNRWRRRRRRQKQEAQSPQFFNRDKKNLQTENKIFQRNQTSLN